MRPCFLVEILSPSTAAIDRREKRLAYATLTSLVEYVIIDQNRMRVESYRRTASGWQGYLLNRPDDLIESSCLEMRLTLEQVYRGVELPDIAEPEPPEYGAEGYPEGVREECANRSLGARTDTLVVSDHALNRAEGE